MNSDQPKDADDKEFYAAIGHALSLWQAVEEVYFQILKDLIRPKNLEGLAAVYYSLSGGGQTRLQIVDAAAEQMLSARPQLLKEWKSLHKAAKNASTKRNELAHLSVFMDVYISETRQYHVLEYVLKHDQHKTLKGTRYEKHLTLQEISEYLGSFINLLDSLRIFLNKLCAPISVAEKKQ
jgi:hypothetical protein